VKPAKPVQHFTAKISQFLWLKVMPEKLRLGGGAISLQSRQCRSLAPEKEPVKIGPLQTVFSVKVVTDVRTEIEGQSVVRSNAGDDERGESGQLQFPAGQGGFQFGEQVFAIRFRTGHGLLKVRSGILATGTAAIGFLGKFYLLYDSVTNQA
jgi:hypothetical protein